MGDGVWIGVQSYVIGRSDQLSLNKIFDPITPSMRKGRDREVEVLENYSENKLGLSCAKLRQANLLRLLLLENSELCKCEKRSTSTEVN